MTSSATFCFLIAAGISIVIQNLLMVNISERASTIVIALVMNACIGLLLLLSVLIYQRGAQGVAEVGNLFRPWMLLPGILGSLFVYAGILGYQNVGATVTISTLVASQLITGLLVDYCIHHRLNVQATFGAALLFCGAYLIAKSKH